MSVRDFVKRFGEKLLSSTVSVLKLTHKFPTMNEIATRRGHNAANSISITFLGPYLRLLFKLHGILSVVSQENHENCYHQISYFKAIMHQNQFQLRLWPRPAGKLTALPRWIFGRTERMGRAGGRHGREKGRGKGSGRGKRKGKRGEEREWRRRTMPSKHIRCKPINIYRFVVMYIVRL